MSPEQELDKYKHIYEQGKPTSEYISNKLKEEYVKSYFIDKLYNMRMYHGIEIHNLPSNIMGFHYNKIYMEKYLQTINKIDVKFDELKYLNPIYYYKLIGEYFVDIKTDKRKKRLAIILGI